MKNILLAVWCAAILLLLWRFNVKLNLLETQTMQILNYQTDMSVVARPVIDTVKKVPHE